MSESLQVPVVSKGGVDMISVCVMVGHIFSILLPLEKAPNSSKVKLSRVW